MTGKDCFAVRIIGKYAEVMEELIPDQPATPQERMIPTEMILDARRRARMKLSPDEAKKRGVDIKEEFEPFFGNYNLNLSSLRRFLALREDFPYRSDFIIEDGPYTLDSKNWHDFAKGFAEENEKWKKQPSWKTEYIIGELGSCITFDWSQQDNRNVIIAVSIETAFLLGIEKEVAAEVIRRFTDKGIAWQQGLPRPGQAASRVESGRGGDSSPAR